MIEMPNILIVEDDGIIAKDLQNILTSMGYEVCGIASDGEEAIRKFEEYKPGLVLMDIVLKGYSDGIETASRIRNRRNTPIIYLTAYTDDMTLVRAKITEPFGYILKPFDEKELLITIEMALYKHEMEANLRKSEENLYALLNATDDPAVLATPDGKVISLNRSAALKFGKEIDAIIGQKLIELLPPRNMEVKLNSLNTVLNTGASADFEENLDGVIYKHSIYPVPDKNGNISRIAIFSRDITEQKKAELIWQKEQKNLEIKQQELIQSVKLTALGYFAAGIARQINDPLVSIKNSAQLCLNNPAADAKIKEQLTEILRNCENTNVIINSLLDYSNLSDFLVQQNDIVKVLNKALSLVKTRCEKQDIEIIKRLSRKSITMFFDEKWMLNAFLNILTNSLDAMEKGGELTVDITKDSDSILLKISDDGQGIPEEIQDKIFEPFFTTKEVNTGLGLSLTQRIIDAHRGKINIESEKGNGTTVLITLPI